MFLYSSPYRKPPAPLKGVTKVPFRGFRGVNSQRFTRVSQSSTEETQRITEAVNIVMKIQKYFYL
jgi:hypothetical protein